MAFAPSKAKKHRRRGSSEMSIQMTSMMDIFTILLTFLLKSFAAEGQIMQIAESIQLPVSTAQEAVHPSVTVAFNGDALYLDGELLIADVRRVQRQRRTRHRAPLRRSLRKRPASSRPWPPRTRPWTSRARSRSRGTGRCPSGS